MLKKGVFEISVVRFPCRFLRMTTPKRSFLRVFRPQKFKNVSQKCTLRNAKSLLRKLSARGFRRPQKRVVFSCVFSIFFHLRDRYYLWTFEDQSCSKNRSKSGQNWNFGASPFLVFSGFLGQKVGPAPRSLF